MMIQSRIRWRMFIREDSFGCLLCNDIRELIRSYDGVYIGVWEYYNSTSLLTDTPLYRAPQLRERLSMKRTRSGLHYLIHGAEEDVLEFLRVTNQERTSAGLVSIREAYYQARAGIYTNRMIL